MSYHPALSNIWSGEIVARFDASIEKRDNHELISTKFVIGRATGRPVTLGENRYIPTSAGYWIATGTCNSWTNTTPVVNPPNAPNKFHVSPEGGDPCGILIISDLSETPPAEQAKNLIDENSTVQTFNIKGEDKIMEVIGYLSDVQFGLATCPTGHSPELARLLVDSFFEPVNQRY